MLAKTWSRATIPKKQSSAFDPSGPQSKLTFLSAPACDGAKMKLPKVTFSFLFLSWVTFKWLLAPSVVLYVAMAPAALAFIIVCQSVSMSKILQLLKY